jgi:hypothetical protein
MSWNKGNNTHFLVTDRIVVELPKPRLLFKSTLQILLLLLSIEIFEANVILIKAFG